MMHVLKVKEMPIIMYLPTCEGAFDKTNIYQYCKEIVKQVRRKPESQKNVVPEMEIIVDGLQNLSPELQDVEAEPQKLVEPECSIFVPQETSDFVKLKIIETRRDMTRPKSGR
jgi:hypothetical protein